MMLEQYLATGGRMGSLPDWYRIGKAAKYWGVAPWELMKQPMFWREKARIGTNAEYRAQKIIEKLNGGG